MSDEHRSAMLLTEGEWAAAASVAKFYLFATSWAEGKRPEPGDERMATLLAGRALCERIVEACS